MESIDVDDLVLKKVVDTNAQLSTIIERIRQNLAVARADYCNYESFTAEEKIKYDIHLSYCVNALFWMYLKVININPQNHEIKDQLARVKAAMVREKTIYDRRYNRPTLDQSAAKRFIRSGLYDPKAKQSTKIDLNSAPPNKKIRFEDYSDDDD